ncbi:MAG: 3-ketoacyl-ACP reductase [Planctomycetaceae bacterium]|jgi:NAD(P)-dependent dehydrogenase (short-subunit alcohol dehydrogenase family)|nr:3-ketoacyl-ACP reductase [Planctomycetaceae bacterium]
MTKTALVTGGVRGIGWGISEALAKNGWQLAVCGTKNAEMVADKKSELEKFGPKVKYYQCNVAESSNREKMLIAIQHDFGAIHLLVNNAGVGARVRADLLEMTEENYEWLMKINLTGPFFLTQEIAKLMIAQKSKTPDFSGCIINLSSISAAVASVSRGEYCISKAGVSMATKLWAVRLAEFGFPVFEIRPGLIKTDMTEAVTEKYTKLIHDGILLQPRWGLPSDIGQTVVTLASGGLPYTTGQVIMLDGGMLVERL